ALVSIFVNHIPGVVYERLTPRNYGLSDSAELFVFLAGWALRIVADHSKAERVGLTRLVLRLGARGVTLYAAQILITMLAIALIAGAAIFLENPLLLEWHNAAAVFQDPVPTHVGLVALSHQLGYFDILPLYVVLMLGAPVLASLHRLAPAAVLPLSLAVYASTLATGFNLPTWPVEGFWFFNPFAWQAVFVLGFLLAGQDGLGAAARRNMRWLRPLGILAVVIGVAVVKSDYAPDPLRVPQPTLVFIFDKTFLSPARLLHFLAIAATFAGSFVLVARHLPRLGRFLSMLGRNSLNVFCVASILSLAGQLTRFALGGSVGVDTLVVVCGVAALGFTAWLSELRERLRQPRPLHARA
ncbi:MAG: OpgC protein, partial [Enterovirga sp.]|nr:OpgC protein [Enterovirga sp.]